MIGNGAEGGVGSVLRDACESAISSLVPHMLSPAEQAVVTVVFRNSRREELHIYTSEAFEFRGSTRIPFRLTHRRNRLVENRDPESRPHRNLFKSIFGSHVSLDFRVSSQVTSRPVYAAVRAIMHERADSAPLSA